MPGKDFPAVAFEPHRAPQRPWPGAGTADPSRSSSSIVMQDEGNGVIMWHA